MKVLSVNAGSSTLKFKLFLMPEAKEIVSGNFEKIGEEGSFYVIKLNDEKIKKEVELDNHKTAFELVVQELIDNKIVSDLSEIKGIGHRIVQGGSYFSGSALATPENIAIVESLAPLAPLHNPAAILGIKSAIEVFKEATQVLVFDTAFHQTMDEATFLYGVPYEWYTKHQVRRYGFHGTSHQYVSMRANELLGKQDTKLITCHLGSGASVAAIKNGKCINTSMGVTPNAGLIMGVRSGDVDVAVIPHIMKAEGLSVDEVINTLTKGSGWLGITGDKSDARDIEMGIASGDEKCILAMEMYIKRLTEYIAKYYVELEGCDAIIFTAGLGERSSLVRKLLSEKLACLGVKIDDEANKAFGEEAKISTADSKIAIYVIPTNEELMIATDVYNLTN